MHTNATIKGKLFAILSPIGYVMLDFLKADYPLQKQLYLVPQFVLSFIGFQPEAVKSNYENAFAFFNFILLAYSCVVTLSYGFANLSVDIEAALDAFCPVGSSVTSLFKIFFLWWHRADLSNLMQRVAVLAEEQHGTNKTAVKRKYFQLATRLSAALCFFAYTTGLAYIARPLLMNALRYAKGDALLWETPFRMNIPAPMLSMPYYPLTYLLMFWYANVTILGFLGTDAFFLGFCFYFAALLKCLQSDLLELQSVQCYKMAELEKEVIVERDEAEIYEKLCQIIARHNEIADLVQLFSKVMVFSTLGHFITASITIGLSIIDLTQFSGVNTIVYIFYTISAITQLFIYCVSGTLIAESSRGVASAAYNFAWYSHSVRVQKLIFLIILRAQRSLIIKVPFFTPSLIVFAQMLKFTGSLITLANSMI